MYHYIARQLHHAQISINKPNIWVPLNLERTWECVCSPGECGGLGKAARVDARCQSSDCPLFPRAQTSSPPRWTPPRVHPGRDPESTSGAPPYPRHSGWSSAPPVSLSGGIKVMRDRHKPTEAQWPTGKAFITHLILLSLLFTITFKTLFF